MGLEEAVRSAALTLAHVGEALAVLVIAVGLLHAVIGFVRGMLRRQALPSARNRLVLGRHLVLALELLLAADILATAVAPAWGDIGKLAAIAAIRTVLNLFLEREIASEERTQGQGLRES